MARSRGAMIAVFLVALSTVLREFIVLAETCKLEKVGTERDEKK